MHEHRLKVFIPSSPQPASADAAPGPARVRGIPVVAGMDFTRVPVALWQESLNRIRQAGATAVATTVFWNHHEPVRGEPVFSGGLDLGVFARLVRATGLDLVLRLGPQSTAGVRYAGLPDWLLELPLLVRSDHPGYLAEVVRWFGQVAAQVAGIPLLALEFDRAAGSSEHLATLKVVTRQVGLDAALWLVSGTTAEGFEAVQVSLPEAYWLSPQLRFQTGLGFAASRGGFVGELGAGMVPAAHRRPDIDARQIAALALARLGAGSRWQQYSPFHDGRNPRPGLQESHAAGSPNDLAVLHHDAGAPLAVDGHRRASWYRLRLQHLLLAAWGERLASMPATLPGEPDPHWAVRSDGHSGFLFVVNRRTGPARPGLAATRFVVETDAGEVVFPEVDVPGSAAFVWPFRLRVGDAELAWATAQPVTVTTWRSRPLLVLAATAGIEPRVQWSSGSPQPLATKGPGQFFELVDDPGATVRWLVLAEPDAWRFGLPDGLELTADGVRDLAPRKASTPVVGWSVTGRAGPPAPAPHGPLDRVGIPTDWSSAARIALHLTEVAGATLVLDWVGDAARLWDGDRLVADALSTGRDWRIPAADLAGAANPVLEIVRLDPGAPVNHGRGRPHGARLNHARWELA